MRLMHRPLSWTLATCLLVVTMPTVSAQSLLDWLRNRQRNVVNVYVPPGAITTAPAGTVVVARPIIVAPATTSPVVSTTVVPTTVVPPAVAPAASGSPVTALMPATQLPAAGATVVPPASAAQGYTVQYRARTRYQTRWVQVPVTVYRPTITVDPVTGAQTTALNACQTHTWQVRRVPVTEWRPLRVLPGPPPASSIPAVTLPAQPAPTVPSAATTGWPSVSPGEAYPASPSVPPPPSDTMTAPQFSQPSSPPPQPTTGSYPSPSGASGGLERPGLSPSEAQRLQKPAEGTKSNTGTGDKQEASGGSNDGPQITPPANGTQPTSGRSHSAVGPSNNGPSGLKPIPSDRPMFQPKSRVRTPQELEDPPQLLDPRDPIAQRRSAPTVVRTSYRTGDGSSAKSTKTVPVPSARPPRKAKPRFDTSGWHHFEPGE